MATAIKPALSVGPDSAITLDFLNFLGYIYILICRSNSERCFISPIDPPSDAIEVCSAVGLVQDI
jgi:hypothetical protein